MPPLTNSRFQPIYTRGTTLRQQLISFGLVCVTTACILSNLSGHFPVGGIFTKTRYVPVRAFASRRAHRAVASHERHERQERHDDVTTRGAGVTLCGGGAGVTASRQKP